MRLLLDNELMDFLDIFIEGEGSVAHLRKKPSTTYSSVVLPFHDDIHVRLWHDSEEEKERVYIADIAEGDLQKLQHIIERGLDGIPDASRKELCQRFLDGLQDRTLEVAVMEALRAQV